ncbi:MAG TPA: hypothetical protein VE692_02450, partial [Nitrososphaera sp.]|nr:hypothetical protein [Nitrososphaera sp.]
AALAALTLIIGTYPDPILNPITGYIQGIFSHSPNVLPLPTNTTTTMTGQFSGNRSTVSTTTNSIPVSSSIIVGMQQQATDKNIVTSSYHEFVNNIQQKTFMIGVLKAAKNIQMQGGVN